MKALHLRAEHLARVAQRKRVAAIARSINDEVSGVTADAGDADVTLSGRGLTRRWLIDPALRFLSSSAR